MAILRLSYNISSVNFFFNRYNQDLSGAPNAVLYVYLEVVSDHFSEAIKILPCCDNGFLFIQTDRCVYNSDESGIIKREF